MDKYRHRRLRIITWNRRAAVRTPHTARHPHRDEVSRQRRNVETNIELGSGRFQGA